MQRDNKLNITPGEWYLAYDIQFINDLHFAETVVFTNENFDNLKQRWEDFSAGEISPICIPLSLITEAGTVANQTGLMPGELLKQRDELLVCLKYCRQWYEEHTNLIEPLTPVCFSMALSAIQNATK